MLLGEEGKGQFFYWWDVAVGSLKLGYTPVRSMKEGRIPTSHQGTFSSCRDGWAQTGEVSFATPVASLVCWKGQLEGGNIWNHCPLQRPCTLLTHLRLICLKACCEMLSHPHFSHLTLHIQQHFKCARNCTKKLFSIDWHNPQTKKNLCGNNLITNYRCSDHFLLWVWAAPLSEESWFRTELSR